MFTSPWARRAALRAVPVPKRDGDEVQLLVADGPGDPSNDDAEREAIFYRGDCQHCGTPIHWISSPHGPWWAHDTHPADGHDAEPRRPPGYTEERGELELACDLSDLTPPTPMPDFLAAMRMRVKHFDELTGAAIVPIPGALGPTPLADELRRDRELLLDANGRLVARVRTLEAQLRAAGIEPAARE